MATVLVAASGAVWLVSGIRLAIIDHRTGRLPTRTIWATSAAVLALHAGASALQADVRALAGSVAGAVLCGVILAVVHLIHPPSLGFGDVRLSVLNGLLCGWWGWTAALLGLFAGFVLAVPEALVVLARHGLRVSRPMGPYLVAGTAAVVVWSVATRGLLPAR